MPALSLGDLAPFQRVYCMRTCILMYECCECMCVNYFVCVCVLFFGSFFSSADGHTGGCVSALRLFSLPMTYEWMCVRVSFDVVRIYFVPLQPSQIPIHFRPYYIIAGNWSVAIFDCLNVCPNRPSVRVWVLCAYTISIRGKCDLYASQCSVFRFFFHSFFLFHCSARIRWKKNHSNGIRGYWARGQHNAHTSPAEPEKNKYSLAWRFGMAIQSVCGRCSMLSSRLQQLENKIMLNGALYARPWLDHVLSSHILSFIWPARFTRVAIWLSF